MSDPVEPIKIIGDRLKEKADALGLEMVQFTLIPDFTGHGNHAIQAVFVLPEGAFVEEEAAPVVEDELPDIPAFAAIPELDDELAGIMAATADAEEELVRAEEESVRAAHDQKEADFMEEARERALKLRQKLSEGKGPLDD